MKSYLLVASEGGLDWQRMSRCCTTARELARRGHPVALYLVQNGVLSARAGARREDLEAAAASGVEIYADDFSLRERGIPADELMSEARPASLDLVLDQLAEGRIAIWH